MNYLNNSVMNRIISFLLFIGSAPYFLFAKDKIESPCSSVEVMVAVILCFLIFSPFIVPFIVLFKVLDFFESPVNFIIFYYSFLGIMFLFSLWKVFSIKKEIIRTYFHVFSKMSKLRAISLFFLIFGIGTFWLLMIFSWVLPVLILSMR